MPAALSAMLTSASTRPLPRRCSRAVALAATLGAAAAAAVADSAPISVMVVMMANGEKGACSIIAVWEAGAR